MAINRGIPYLICYDIASPKRLQRLHRKVAATTEMIQYSVYFSVLNQRQLSLLIAEIEGCIDPSMDDVRIYPLPNDAQVDALGIQKPLCLPVSETAVRMNELLAGRLH